MTVAAVRAGGAINPTAVTAIAGVTNNNQLKAIRGSRRNDGGGASGDSGDGNGNSNSNEIGNGDSNDVYADVLCTLLKVFFSPLSALAE
jgi:hypothetical protein